jgi:hypothetical protein
LGRGLGALRDAVDMFIYWVTEVLGEVGEGA